MCELLAYTAKGYLKGQCPAGAMIIVAHTGGPRTGYQLYWKGRWYKRFGQARLKDQLGIGVREKKTGDQQGYPSETVLYAAWRHFIDQFNRLDSEVEFTHDQPPLPGEE